LGGAEEYFLGKASMPLRQMQAHMDERPVYLHVILLTFQLNIDTLFMAKMAVKL